MTRTHQPPARVQEPQAPAECVARDFGSNASSVEGLGKGEGLAQAAGSWTEAAGEEVSGSATVQGSATALTDGLRGEGALRGAVSGKTVDGLSFQGSMELGGGLVARARALPTADPEAVLVEVTVGASASFGGAAGGGQGSASLGLSGAIGGSSTSTVARVVGRGEASGLWDAWERGDRGPWFATFASLAAVGRYASDAAEMGVSELSPGEYVAKTGAVDAKVCVPAGWQGVKVSAGASHHGERRASAEALPDGTLVVEVGFDTTVSREADGSVVVGALALGAGVEDVDRAGVTVRFWLDREIDGALAADLLAVASAAELERAAAAAAWAVVQHEVRRGEGRALTPRATAGAMLGFEHEGDVSEAVSLGAEGLDGSSFEGESSFEAGLSVAGRDLVGISSTSSLSAEVDGGAVTARLSRAEATTGLGGSLFGTTPNATWPEPLLASLVRDRRHLFALDLSEADVEDLVRVRPLRVDAWDRCGLVAGVAEWQAWKAVGADLRALEAPPAWVEAAGQRVADLAAGMRLLTAFVGEWPNGWRALFAATRRFGFATGEESDHEALGDVSHWPPGTEPLAERTAKVLARKETLRDDLDAAAAAGDRDAGRELHHAIEGPLGALTQQIPGLPVDDPLWQADTLRRLSEVRAEVGWEFAMFERRFAECDPSTGDDLAIGAAEGKEREAFVLLGTMQAYAKTEQGVLDGFSGAWRALPDLQDELTALYRPWGRAHRQWSALASEGEVAPTPSWDAYRARLLEARVSRSESEAMFDTTRRAWKP